MSLFNYGGVYMSKKNNDFFVQKKDWSEVKDALLACYLKPYITKILCTNKPIIYVDCFAGQGMFDDGKAGSPIIALDIIEQCKNITTISNPNIYAYFIELNHFQRLKENIARYPYANISIGKYENNIRDILLNKQGCNVFLYLDPYGIKGLKWSLFDSFAQMNFNTIELLINMNSFGFIREACRVFNIKFKEESIFEDLIEYETTTLDNSTKSIDELNEIAGGSYWQPIIQEMKSGFINGYKAEERFMEEYCKNMSRQYKYVLNMPIRIKQGQHPKYRLVHVTNHPEGCILMANNICKRWEAMREIQNGGQMPLFDEDYENNTIDDQIINKFVYEYFSGISNVKKLSEAQAGFYVKYGPICSLNKINDALKRFEKNHQIEILRNPSNTKTGKVTTFMTEGKGQTVSIRWLK